MPATNPYETDFLLPEARWYHSDPDGRATCRVCPHTCRIRPGRKGACGLRYNHGGALLSLAARKPVWRTVEPVEKKPLYHFFPGMPLYSLGTAGCSLRCSYCHNWAISQWPRARLGLPEPAPDDGPPREDLLVDWARHLPGSPCSPRDLVQEAREAGAEGIAYTFSEPTVFAELALDTARQAHAEGLWNVWVTNGYITPEVQEAVLPWVDAVNVDLKFFRERSYRRQAGGRLAPVLAALRRFREAGCWVEVSTVVAPGLNDGSEELREMADFIAGLGRAVPWHLRQLRPAFRDRRWEPTPPESLDRARTAAGEAGLHHVYVHAEGSVGATDTPCPGCGRFLYRRCGDRLSERATETGACPSCGKELAGCFPAATENQPRDKGFPST